MFFNFLSCAIIPSINGGFLLFSLLFLSLHVMEHLLAFAIEFFEFVAFSTHFVASSTCCVLKYILTP